MDYAAMMAPGNNPIAQDPAAALIRRVIQNREDALSRVSRPSARASQRTARRFV